MKQFTAALLAGAVVLAPPLAAMETQQVAGTWLLEVFLELGEGEATFVLTLEDEEIKGTYTGVLGEQVPVHGAVTEEGIRFSFDSEAGTVTFEGKVEGDTMKGTCDYGALGTGTFEGKRQE